MDRREFLELSGVGLGGLAFGRQWRLNPLEPALRERARAKGLFYGAAVASRFLKREPDFAERFALECGILVPEGELRWQIVHPEPDRYDFTGGDYLADYARQHQILYRGHVLLYANDLPHWLVQAPKDADVERMVGDHIRAVAGRYAGRMQSWDVVNEIVELSDKRPDGLRKTPLLERLGPDYVQLAFQTAAAADPKALLTWNTNNVEYQVKYQQDRREAVLKLLQQLRSKGVPVQALGIQSHLRFHETQFDAKAYRAFLASVAGLGVKIIVSELDVTDTDLPDDPAERDRGVAEAYAQYLPVALDEPAVLGVITWGFSDRHTWLTGFRPRKAGGAARPLPFGTDMKPTLAYVALAQALDGAPARS